MPLALRATKQIENFSLPVSYRIYERRDRFADALNVFSNQGRLETRFGFSRYNDTSIGGSVLSISYFTKSDSSQYTIAKVGTSLYSVATSGASTEIKSGLSSGTKHRGITFNNRHIISVEGDGLFSWDGTTFSQLGQDPPSTLSAAASAGGSLTDGHSYKGAITYYSSALGFESNYQESGTTAVSGGNLTLALTNIPATAANGFVDKVRIYLKDVTDNSDFLYIDEIDLGTTSYNVTAESSSAVTPPETHGAPLSGGGKFLTVFNGKIVYAGNTTYQNDVWFSEEYLPDAYDGTSSQVVLTVPGSGGITGIATGLFNDGHLDPFLVVFKRKSIHIYSELGGSARFVPISYEVGCVGHDTISVRNGAIYFLSDDGWRAIYNGFLVKNSKGKEITLGDGDIDDIFKSEGYVYQVNRSTIDDAFSVYYPTLDQYMTWVGEGSNTSFTKTYVYEFDSAGFKPYSFNIPATCACTGEDASFRDVVLFGASDGFIYKHSTQEDRTDIDSDGNNVAIAAHAILPWYPESSDFDATYSFRELILKCLSSEDTLTVKTFLNYNMASLYEYDYTFADPESGFVLDVSRLDDGVFGNERNIVTSRNDINRTGESLALGFYQSSLNANMGIVAMQIDSSKNGSRN